jgi:ribonuclease-3
MDDERRKKILELLKNELFKIEDASDDALELYDIALTHSSFAKENTELNNIYQDNERLEFLGNFVLGLVVSEYLYSEFNYSEGAMTKRMEVVSDAKLAQVIKNHRLGLERGYLRLGKRSENTNMKLEDSIIAGWFEAFIGAIYLDRGLERTREIIIGLLSNEIKNFNPHLNYIGRLQEFVHQNKLGELEYFEKRMTGPDHSPTFKATVKIENKKFGDGTGTNKKAARMKAAKAALKKLRDKKLNK